MHPRNAAISDKETSDVFWTDLHLKNFKNRSLYLGNHDILLNFTIHIQQLVTTLANH